MREEENIRDASRRLRNNLTGTIATLQSASPSHLLPRGYAADTASEILFVSGASVRRFMNECVSTGRLVEIRPHRDWRIELPGGEALPELYAVKAGETYRMARQKPDSRGAGQTSFIITPRGLETLLREMREQYGVAEPVADTPSVYEDSIPRYVTQARYDQLVAMVGEDCGLNDKTARKAVDGMLNQLNLHLA